MAYMQRKLQVLVVVSSFLQWIVNGEQQVPCYFIFGDSLADNGNNNAFVSTAKANYNPYGIDFVDGTTGRFTNGRTTVDIIAEHLGFDNYIMSFARARLSQDLNFLRGVNYASGAAGIRKETGKTQGARISMDDQLRNHRTIVMRIMSVLGDVDSARKYLSKCIYTVGMGNNDYINNYYMPLFYSTSQQYTPEQYAQILIQKYSQQLKRLYKYGARKVAIFGLGQLGCVLRILATYDTKGSACVVEINNSAKLFNKKLISLVEDLNSNLTDATFTYINEYGSEDTSSIGSLIANTSCCQVVSGTDTCVPFLKPCSNRDEYIFWDAVHPTESLNLYSAATAYSGESPTEVYPFNISELALFNSVREWDAFK